MICMTKLVHKITFAIILSFLVCMPYASADALQVPLLDRELFFSDPEYAGAQVSPNGKLISFLKPHQDVMNIWVKKYDQAFDKAWPVTADTKRPVTSYFWSEDSAHILYRQDQGGNEDYHVYALDPREDVRKQNAAPARDLTPLEGIRAFIYSVPEATPDRLIIGLNDRDPRIHDVYSVSIRTGERKLLVRNEVFASGWLADLNGNIRLAIRQNQEGSWQMLKVQDGKTGDVIYQCSSQENCYPIRFHKDGKQFYIATNKGDNIDLMGLSLVDYRTGKVEFIESDPEGQVDFGGASFSDKTEELVATWYTDNRVRVYHRSKWHEDRWDKIKSRLPDGELAAVSSTEDDTTLVVALNRDVNPGSVHIFEGRTDKLVKLYDSRPELPTEHLAGMQAITYTARDGVKIPAYLTLPRQKAETNLPVVILPHGGPWARDVWGYSSMAQFLANRGYAVLQPNFRGSAGYGKSYLNAGNRGWGTGIMQHDISDGVAHLVKKKIADPKRIAIMGGSYGGYATLAGVTFTPNLYAAGISLVGPSNLLTLLNSIPPYWAPARKMWMLRVGDLDTEEGRAQLRSQSPFFHAKQIRVPMLIVQGANDPRVKKAESDQIVVALREGKQPVEYLLAENEGHGYVNEDNRMAMFVAIEVFLSRHIGGRYQKVVPKNIADRITQLQVDINTVTLPDAK